MEVNQYFFHYKLTKAVTKSKAITKAFLATSQPRTDFSPHLQHFAKLTSFFSLQMQVNQSFLKSQSTMAIFSFSQPKHFFTINQP